MEGRSDTLTSSGKCYCVVALAIVVVNFSLLLVVVCWLLNIAGAVTLK